MFVFKIIILGDQGSGKTSLINKYLKREYNSEETSTIGADFGSKTLDICKIFDEQLLKEYREKYGNKYYNLEKLVKLQIYDTSGQCRFNSIISTYYRNTQGVIFVCDLTKRITMDNLRRWIDDYNRMGTEPLEKVSGIIVGMKSDLKKMQQITEEELKSFAEEYGLKSFMISAKYDTEKIEKLFNEMLSQMFRKYINDDNDNKHIRKYENNDNILKIETPKKSLTCCDIL